MAIAVDDELIWMIETLNARLSGERAAELLPMGITPTQANILRAVGRHRQLTAQEIATELGQLRIPSRIIYSLVVSRSLSESTNDDDRREKLYELTKKGRSQLNGVRRVDRALAEREFSSINAAQRRTLGKLVETLLVTED